MTNSVLFDVPGPKTKARHRIYEVVTVVAAVALVAVFLWKMEEKGQLEYSLWEYFVTPSYLEVLGEAIVRTLSMAMVAIVFAVVLGLVLGVGKLSDHAVVRWTAWTVVEFFRAMPVLLLMLFLFSWLSIGDGPLSPFWCVVGALTLYNGAVLAEVFRAGVNAVPAGQAEAAYAIGMRKTQVMVSVLLPQAVKMMLPALISQMVVALKDTSLGYYITAPGLTFFYKEVSGEARNYVQAAIVVTAIYVVLNLILTWIATKVQKRLVGEKPILAVNTNAGPTTSTTM